MDPRKLIAFLILIVTSALVAGQNMPGTMEGKVSYVTSKNVYVKFTATGDMKPGDTLYKDVNGTLDAALVVRELSSISCVCLPLAGYNPVVGDTFLARIKEKKQAETLVPPAVVPGSQADQKPDTARRQVSTGKKPVQLIHGNIGVASYLNFSDASSNTQRMKYSLALGIDNIGGSKLSAETYMLFAHKLDSWDEIKSDVFNGLKVYSLAFNYRFNEYHRLWLGRKINPRISSIGAIDGVQYEYKPGAFTIGVIGGTRPDNENYSFDPSLFELGAYVAHDFNGRNGTMQSTLAFFNQLNSGMTDRRFFYLQHSNALVRNLWFFGSAEVDIYNMEMNAVDTVQQDTTYSATNSPSLSNLYLSLRYRPVRQLSLSVSYSARQNVIYYETYKDYLARLLEAATVQGFVFSVNYQPWRPLTIGVNLSYRDSRNDPRPTKNLYGFVTYSNIPGVGLSATGSAMLLETSYLSGQIYGLSVSRDFLKGKLSGGLGYRYVSYKFVNNAPSLVQNMAEVNLNWRILKKLTAGIYYEGTFDTSSVFNRLYLVLTQRF